MKAILFINPKKEYARNLASEIKSELEHRGFGIDSFMFDRETQIDVQADYDLALSLGGDGTVLYAVRNMAPLGVPVLPVNLGTLGFIAGVHPENWKQVFEDWQNGRARLSRRLMLETTVMRRGREIVRNICLNEAVVSSPGIIKIIRLEVSLRGGVRPQGKEFLHLGQYRSDGLIVATPTGSTAHSAAAGGPILDPEIEAFILNPICPFTLSHRPLVLPADETVLIEVEEELSKGLLLTMDGQVPVDLEGGERIFISSSPHRGILIASDKTVFYDALKTKFSFMSVPASSKVRSGHA